MKIKGKLAVPQEGGGGQGELPPPRNGKNVVKIWFYLPEVYTFGAEAEIFEKFREKL